MNLILILVWLIVGVSTEAVVESKIVIEEKMIAVEGQTSIGGFNCKYVEKGYDTLFVDFENQKVPDLIFDILVDDFGCGNFILNRDFKKTIKSKEFPKARVRVRNLMTKKGKYYCDLSVNMVGKRLDFEDLELERVSEGVKTHLVLGFSDLGLETPKKMGGLIKVEEELHLELILGFSTH
ncbi:hypothetical protein [Pararhodonellum marinum]|uniref:hypothetical protein n=1 Tax=Pararhodonellum marinum TaxID=2755358 RepID=UPI00188E3779|nr:hypothetical protein [Pararhodonellum marinum]